MTSDFYIVVVCDSWKLNVPFEFCAHFWGVLYEI